MEPFHKIFIVMNSRLQKHGSFEDFMIWMARRARLRNFEIHFIFPAMGTPRVGELLEAEQAKVHIVAEDWKSVAGMKALIALHAKIKPTLANFHFCERLQIVPVLLACRLMGISVIAHYHGEIRPLHQVKWRNRHFSLLRLISFFANRIVTVSNANKRFLEELNVAAPVDMIYNGIDTETFEYNASAADNHQPAMTAQLQNLGQAVESRSFRGAGGKVRFLYIGQLIQRKRVPVLIEAFGRMHRDFPNSELTIIGGGEVEAYCRQLASEANLGEALRFMGLMPQYPFDQLRSSDVFVSASESESFGLVFTEAMCMGLPVVACRVGGIPEVVIDRETGLLVPPNDVDSLAAAMLETAQHIELRNSLGDAGYRRVKELFDLSDKVDSILNLFGKVANRETVGAALHGAARGSR